MFTSQISSAFPQRPSRNMVHLTFRSWQTCPSSLIRSCFLTAKSLNTRLCTIESSTICASCATKQQCKIPILPLEGLVQISGSKAKLVWIFGWQQQGKRAGAPIRHRLAQQSEQDIYRLWK